jgi:hypothetical protein
VTTLSDADLSPTPQDVVVRPVDPSLQFAIVDTFVNNTFQVLEEIGTEVNIVYFLLWRGLQQHIPWPLNE